MASSININAGKGSLDHLRMIDLKLDLSAAGENVTSYPTGGIDLPAALDAEIPQGLVGRNIAIKASATTHYAAWNASTRKVQVFTDVNLATEVTNGTDLSAVVNAPMVILGY